MVMLDLGCGTRKQEGFIGVDSLAFDGVDWLCILSQAPWRFVKNACAADVPVEWERAAIEGGSMFRGEGWPRDGMRFALPDESVDEVHCSHMVEHLKPDERIQFVNELHRVLKKGGKAAIITPHYASVRAFGDLTHQWPPVVSFWYLYLNAEWRKTNAPHNDAYTCDFDHGYGFSLHPAVQLRNQEYQNYAVIHLLEAAQDLHVTLTKR